MNNPHTLLTRHAEEYQHSLEVFRETISETHSTATEWSKISVQKSFFSVVSFQVLGRLLWARVNINIQLEHQQIFQNWFHSVPNAPTTQVKIGEFSRWIISATWNSIHCCSCSSPVAAIPDRSATMRFMNECVASGAANTNKWMWKVMSTTTSIVHGHCLHTCYHLGYSTFFHFDFCVFILDKQTVPINESSPIERNGVEIAIFALAWIR